MFVTISIKANIGTPMNTYAKSPHGVYKLFPMIRKYIRLNPIFEGGRRDEETYKIKPNKYNQVYEDKFFSNFHSWVLKLPFWSTFIVEFPTTPRANFKIATTFVFTSLANHFLLPLFLS